MKIEKFSPTAPTAEADQMLNDLADALEIPASRYEAAERSYKSVGNWLDRPGSRLANHETTIYPQGSFRLGTVIKPLDDEEDYDLDVVCEIEASKAQYTQSDLKRIVGLELQDYARSKGMQMPEEARRCWTLNYADGAQFHMDVLPSLPDGARQRILVEAMGYSGKSLENALAITDVEHKNYRSYSEDWPGSNPKGYAEWFRFRMQSVFDAKRRAMALNERASVEEIPEHRVRTPLQAAIKILKRHRDMRFSEEADVRPISIIITTLAAHAYNQEVRISDALQGILQRMDSFIEVRNGVYWIPNPTDPRENFADKWEDRPDKKDAFYSWLEMARTDFDAAARAGDVDGFIDALAPRMGRPLLESATAKRQVTGGLLGRVRNARSTVSQKVRKILDAPHRKPLVWRELAVGAVAITDVTVTRRGFRPYAVDSDDDALPKHCDLVFQAQTNISRPYKVYWQVVNTGLDARNQKGLRGGFEEGVIQEGFLEKRESTLYAGAHSIECFIVKDGYCVARSGLFVVNII